MKRTTYEVRWGYDNEITLGDKITCEVTGEMCDGRKVWTDIETKEQYFLYKIGKYYYFMKG